MFADHELPRVFQLGRSLSHVRENDWLEGSFEGSDGHYVYSERVHKIAKKSGIAGQDACQPSEAESATA